MSWTIAKIAGILILLFSIWFQNYQRHNLETQITSLTTRLDTSDKTIADLSKANDKQDASILDGARLAAEASKKASEDLEKIKLSNATIKAQAKNIAEQKSTGDFEADCKILEANFNQQIKDSK